jgi:aromatic ring-cleaving dioxygenase
VAERERFEGGVVSNVPYHAHVYYSDAERSVASALRDCFSAEPNILFVGQMTDRGVGPHPIPQFEIHFHESARDDVIAMIDRCGLRALVHPLTHDDLADHTELGHWIGEPLELDLSTLDPPGHNQGVARFGKTAF